ncbi:MAG: sugar ABC transporter permease [Actinobacteria bacterium]|nr:sugar ABC transporter permease [Actinomycetota bacterium]
MRNKLIKASDRRVEKEGYCGLLAHNTQSAMLFIIPSLIVLSFVILYPIIRSLILSFYNYELLKPGVMNFVFLDNFKTLFKDEIFWISFKNTVIFTGFTVSICIVLGLVIAIAFDQLPIKFEKYRGLILIPWVIPGVVSGFLFRYMFDFEIGIVNYVLKSLHIIKEYLPWLTQGN